jgi:inhibitor of KinA sporulation pathway (predicted exonuclease)
MNYVVVDLEWNQAMSSKSSVFNRLPIHLRGEIIEIGAIKLDENLQPCDEFTVDVKPVYFKRMHYKVKKLTGFDSERLSHGLPFAAAFEKFRSWCGGDTVFITWGYDDQGIMEQNIIVHDLDWDWISGWINLQLIYNQQLGEDKNQKSLTTAMEKFHIEQTRTAHDALGDAYNTALISTRLDLRKGLEDYPSFIKGTAGSDSMVNESETEIIPVNHDSFTGFLSKNDVFASEEIGNITCPKCGHMMYKSHWINQGDQRYMNIFSCSDDDIHYLVRYKFHKDENSRWNVTRLIYNADRKQLEFYKCKARQARARARHNVPRSKA